MKLQQTKIFDAYNITHYGEGYLLVNREQRFESGVVVTPQEILEGWCGGGFDTLSLADMERLRDMGAEIVLIGTGPRQRFPQPQLLRPLIEARIGFEVMDSAAACRTYNILMAEGRKVAAAILFQ
ncbi:MAG: Mth938-like domain-containing protein [Rhodocyclaceae bacterium]|nr:Mth938-like domain-containing protein [Rhodocyclaceae bacterium]